MIGISICDPHPDTPQYDFYTIYLLGWAGFAIPQGKYLGEWAWVGRAQ